MMETFIPFFYALNKAPVLEFDVARKFIIRNKVIYQFHMYPLYFSFKQWCSVPHRTIGIFFVMGLFSCRLGKVGHMTTVWKI